MWNKVFASGQAIREASLTVLRPPVHGSETSRTQKRSLCGFAASSGVLNPQLGYYSGGDIQHGWNVLGNGVGTNWTVIA